MAWNPHQSPKPRELTVSITNNNKLSITNNNNTT